MPLTIGAYSIAPKRVRRWVILLASWAFFWAVSETLIVYLLISIVLVHYFGLWLGALQTKSDALLKSAEASEKKALKARCLKKQRLVMAGGVCINLGILLFLKYSPFFTANINTLLAFLGTGISIEIPSYALPIGISFYTLQALAYLFDVYRKKIPADTNILRLALFMSFFPQIMEGPICRYSDTAERLWEARPISYHNLTFGVQRICLGLAKKLIVADRLNLFIKNIFGNYANYDGCVIAVAIVFYTLQLYMDFSGTMDIALGTGEIFGVSLPENFKRPFFSTSISEFWKRWHITLGTWFKDYVFFPISMAKPLKKLTIRARKHLGNHFGPLVSGSIALFAVWLGNGLWHGAGWHYIFFGMYHFVLILLGNAIVPYAIKLCGKLNISRKGLPYRIFQIVRTSILVCIGELFFRADNLIIAFGMLGKTLTNFNFSSFYDGTLLKCGMDGYDFIVILIVVLVLFAIGLIQEKGISIREAISKRNVVLRLCAYEALIIVIIVFGAYGTGYVALDPIYAKF